MLVHTNTTNTSCSTPTPGSSSSTSNTLEPSPQSSAVSGSSTNGHATPKQQQQQQQKQQQQPKLLPPHPNARHFQRAHSLLDSPTLARVERARLRLEASSQQQLQQNFVAANGTGGGGGGGSSSGSNATTMNRENSLERSILDPRQSLLAGRIPVASMTGPIKRGLLWQQRDRLFSRWKERYFVLTRDYLHCFKRASGSANERASDMGQFIFKVKLVDVEKVEWLNRRSYSAIGLLLGREGRVLLRCDDGLEDWFELLEECTLTSKERRRALKIAQGPRSRASLAAPVSHASLQSTHFGLGSTYSSALDDWLMTNGSGAVARHKIGAGNLNGFIAGTNSFLFSDSVPDLSALNNENHNHLHSGISTNHSTPQKIPYRSANNAAANNSAINMSRYSNGYGSQSNSFSNCNGFFGSPRRIFINSNFGSNNVVDEECEEGEVQLRRPRQAFRNNGGINNNVENGNEVDHEWMYRKPRAPTDMRHSVQPLLPTHNTNNSNVNLKADLDYSAHDSGLDTPPSTHRPSSYREATNGMHQISARDSTDTNVSSSRGTLLNSPGGSFRAQHMNQITNLNQLNQLHGSRYSVQERILKIRNEEDRCASIKSANRLNNNTDCCDTNQNQNQQRFYKNGNGGQSPVALTPQHTPLKMHAAHMRNGHVHVNGNGNANSTAAGGTLNGNVQPNGSAIFRERYQHPALTAIINEAQCMKFRDRSYSDCQQFPARRSNNNNPSPLTQRRHNDAPIFGTPTRV